MTDFLIGLVQIGLIFGGLAICLLVSFALAEIIQISKEDEGDARDGND